jgi:hypothetical protein
LAVQEAALRRDKAALPILSDLFREFPQILCAFKQSLRFGRLGACRHVGDPFGRLENLFERYGVLILIDH